MVEFLSAAWCGLEQGSRVNREVVVFCVCLAHKLGPFRIYSPTSLPYPMNMQTKYRTFGGGAPDGLVGFRTGRRYLVRCTRREDGQITIELEYGQLSVRPPVLSKQEFEQWWRQA